MVRTLRAATDAFCGVLEAIADVYSVGPVTTRWRLRNVPVPERDVVAVAVAHGLHRAPRRLAIARPAQHALGCTGVDGARKLDRLRPVVGQPQRKVAQPRVVS
jgi:hypothetical protein